MEVNSFVHSTGIVFCLICISPLKWILPLAIFGTGHWTSTVPDPFIGPVHTRAPLKLAALSEMFLYWQPPWVCGMGLPNLSIQAWVMQACPV